MEFIFADDMSQVIAAALEPLDAPGPGGDPAGQSGPSPKCTLRRRLFRYAGRRSDRAVLLEQRDRDAGELALLAFGLTDIDFDDLVSLGLGFRRA